MSSSSQLLFLSLSSFICSFYHFITYCLCYNGLQWKQIYGFFFFWACQGNLSAFCLTAYNLLLFTEYNTIQWIYIMNHLSLFCNHKCGYKLTMYFLFPLWKREGNNDQNCHKYYIPSNMVQFEMIDTKNDTMYTSIWSPHYKVTDKYQ